jgi:CHAD domain-containing protein
VGDIEATLSPIEEPPALHAPTPAIALLLTAEGAARLARLPMLAAYRAGRPKKTAVLTVWHDTADRALAAAGLSLSETRGQWRVERLRPKPGEAWLPAHAAPVLTEASARQTLAEGLLADVHGTWAPIAAFSGFRRDVPLSIEGVAAKLTVLEGDLRGVVAQRPVRRLVLEGPPFEMAKLATLLAGQIALEVPLASLGAEALALATGIAAAPRHKGGPAVAQGSSVGEALTGIVSHLADVILYWAPLVGAAETDEPVHQMRVGLRRLRSALSIFRRAVRDDTAWLDSLAAELKTLAALLGTARDWDVFLAGIGAEVTEACGHDPRLVSMLAAAARKRDAAYAVLRAHLGGSADWRRLGLHLALLPTLQPWAQSGSTDQAERLAAPAETYAASALGRRLKRLLEIGGSLDGVPAEQRHDIRKQAKALRYTIEFMAPLFAEKQVRRYLARLEDLQEDFGTYNDAAVAAGLAASLGGGAGSAFAAGAVQGFGAAAQLRAGRHVARAWGRFYRSTPFWD